jgi:hypothetical protein
MLAYNYLNSEKASFLKLIKTKSKKIQSLLKYKKTITTLLTGLGRIG